MRHAFLLLALAALVSACTATSAIPDGYSGPQAVIKDSVANVASTSADFFFVDQVNGRNIGNALAYTAQANQGRGLAMTPHDAQRPVPAGPLTLHVGGRTHFAAPFLEIVHGASEIGGVVHITAESGATYLVKGELGANLCSVWIADEQSGKQMGNKLVANGCPAGRLLPAHPKIEEIAPTP